MALTERQKRFVDFYIQTGNASEAARRSGYSANIANRIGTENLAKPVIREAIDARLKELDSARTADTKEILEFMTSVMRGEVTEVVVTTVRVEKGLSKVKKVKVPVKVHDRLRAAELLAKIHGAFVVKQEIEINGNVPVVLVDDVSE